LVREIELKLTESEERLVERVTPSGLLVLEIANLGEDLGQLVG
jgi:hypothetical protein